MGTSEKTPLHKKEGLETSPQFSTTLGMVCTCMGTAVGTGNIWRYPRVVAATSGKRGALCFLMVWVFFLIFWSIPMLVIEYSLGRYTREAVTHSFKRFIGTRASWCGYFISAVQFCIGAYYTVILGWCIYYTFYFIIHPLPTDYTNSSAIFNDFAQGSYWPILTQAISVILTGIILMKGVSSIERANLFLAPALLLLLVAFFIWSTTRPFAIDGLRFFFSPDWDTLADPYLWIEAASQNAFDTGAGSGVFVCYAAYMGRRDPAVKLSVGIPVLNNLVSLLCGMMIFSTVFSSLTLTNPGITDAEILEILQTSGPGSTGLTFMWLPVLLQSAGTVGRIMAVLFFLCLIFAALSSNLAMQEIAVHLFEDYGVPRKIGVPATQLMCFIVGLGSALNLNYLSNQDTTWGFALVLNGLMLITLVVIFGTTLYREKIVNEFGIGDWQLPKIWEYLIKITAPIFATILVGWWFIDNIVNDDTSDGFHWYEFGPNSMISVLLQWILVFIISISLTIALECIRPKWYEVEPVDPDNLGITPADGNHGNGFIEEPTGSINQAADVKEEDTILEMKESS